MEVITICNATAGQGLMNLSLAAVEDRYTGAEILINIARRGRFEYILKRRKRSVNDIPKFLWRVFVFSESEIEHDTIQAFMETEYHVFGDSPFVLRIGELNSALAAACKHHGAEFCAYITACNPNCKPLDDEGNAQRHALFRQELKGRSLAFIEGEGRHPSNGWPGEASFLIFGIDLESARYLSRQMQQDAFVWADFDSRPQLILLR